VTGLEVWNVVVVDDRSRFPLHVWRYLSRDLGFGTGEVRPDGTLRRRDGEKNAEEWIGASALASADGSVRVWWVCADSEWRQRLATVLSQVAAGERVLGVVDVHGRRGSGYRVEEACETLQQRGRAYLVSAYHPGTQVEVGGQSKDVLPKSHETLRQILRGVRCEPPTSSPQESSPQDTTRHILVTGAGFEVRGARGGFGLPATRQLLEEMGPPFHLDGDPPASEESLRLRRTEGFPLPDSGGWSTDVERVDSIRPFALEQNLDQYWDTLLEQEIRMLVGQPIALDAEEREVRKSAALLRERRLREAFRRALLEHDWGYMNHSIAAARLPWYAWLTTNYTHFADRAIAVAGTAPDQAGFGPWRVIATGAEARILTREHALRLPPLRPRRCLFKLHGDIAHLQTMAIAGYDKDAFGPLSMPIEDLSEIYAAAVSFLNGSLAGAEPRIELVVWHLVGHGLQDRWLRALLASVARFLGPDRQHFLLVNPTPAAPQKRLLASLRQPHLTTECKLDAGAYMARVERLGLPANGGGEALVKWTSDVLGPSRDG
jgi:hypothetical protein